MATILQIINSDKNLSFFCKGLKASGLEEKLNEPGPFTLLGPVNLAFSRLDTPNRDDLFLPVNSQKLLDMISGHILAGKIMVTDFGHTKKLKTITGQEVTASVQNGEIHINGSKILARDRQAQNGVVHSVDAVYTV